MVCGLPARIISSTVSFHNFKSQNFKLSVSNPKSKYVAYLSVLSQISNCQGLGRKKRFEILKTGRSVMLGGARGSRLQSQTLACRLPLSGTRIKCVATCQAMFARGYI